MACKLQITGIVQGVGFRPFVARLAAESGLCGSVKNTGGAVDVFLLTDLAGAEAFARALKENAPPVADIKVIEITEAEEPKPGLPHAGEAPVSPDKTSGFFIEESETRAGAKYFPPDLGMCAECEEEIDAGSAGRRVGYAFNSCVNCGPRYTIIEKFPYDRVNTSMKDFRLCEACAKEYGDAADRRYRAETVCCNDCDAPRLVYYDPRRLAQVENPRRLAQSLDVSLSASHNRSTSRDCASGAASRSSSRDCAFGAEGSLRSKDCAFGAEGSLGSEEKSVGGDAIQGAEEALAAGRVIIVKGIGGYHLMCRADSEEAVAAVRELKGRDTKPFANIFYDMEEIRRWCEVSEEERELLISPARPIVLLRPREGSGIFTGRIGAFLPYTPLHKLLLKNVRRAVATSLNIGGAPIVTDDGEAIAFSEKAASPLLAGVLYNNRQILRRAEDSVVQVINGKPGIIRRARGYVPLPFDYDFGKIPMLALGGDLKAAFGIYACGSTVVSPYCGDLEHPEAFDVYKETIRDLLNLFEVRPEIIVADAHPGYFTHEYAKVLARRFGAGLEFVYHHYAHIASVIAEHGLCGKVLGVAFDGTGYGPDGSVWGGEFLICEGKSSRRFRHLEYVKLLGSDSAARDALKTAECFLHHRGINKNVHSQSKIIRAALDGNINVYKTTSAGRLFDAEAALSGLCVENTYEGECAMALQYAAEAGDPAALAFHASLAGKVFTAAEDARAAEGIDTVALSGGVFQNSLFAEMVTRGLSARAFEVFINEKFPANDGGICLGQLYVAGGNPQR